MLTSELTRQILLVLVGLVFLLLALRTWLQPERVAGEVGYRLLGPNGYSELHAIYCGLWLAHAGLAGYAAWRVEQAVLGDVLALLILAQPLGRLLAMPRHGPPRGALAGFLWLELIGATLLLLVRP
ncbi:MAG: DUF4345 family protein [Xanthomonadales bacterium]|nr:DUF4345 family protein [Xanthomonadales bacterium]MCB1629484.1 DUF4345 family protein [Xanthomonadales bacterium]